MPHNPHGEDQMPVTRRSEDVQARSEDLHNPQNPFSPQQVSILKKFPKLAAYFDYADRENVDGPLPEKWQKLSELSEILQRLISKFNDENGKMNQILYEDAPESEKQFIISIANDIKQIVFQDPEGFLRSKNAQMCIQLTIMRKECIKKALEKIALESPEKAFEMYVQTIESWGPDSDPEKSSEKEMQEIKKGFITDYMYDQKEQLVNSFDESPIEKANALMALKERAQLEGIYFTMQYDVLTNMIVRAFEKIDKKNIENQIFFYRQLKDGFPGLGMLPDKIRSNFYDIYEKYPDEDKYKKFLDTFLESAPEILLLSASDYYSAENWTKENRLQFIQKILEIPNGKKSSLSNIKLYNLPEITSSEILQTILETQLEYNAIMFEFNLNALNNVHEQAKNALIIKAIQKIPSMIASDFKKWKPFFTEKQLDIFIQNTLDDPYRYTSIDVQPSHEQLQKHFAKKENQHAAEYKRVITIFHCIEFFENELQSLENDTPTNLSKEAKLKKILLLGILGVQNIKDPEKYVEIKQKLLGYALEKGSPITEKAAQALAELAKNGDVDIAAYFANILKERPKISKNKDEKQGVLGLTSVQELALRTLTHINTQTTNEQLLNLVFVEDLDPRVRTLILKKIATNNNTPFPPQTRQYILNDIQTKKSRFNSKDLLLFKSILQIPSADLRKKSIEQFDGVFMEFIENKQSPKKVQNEQYPAVPENIFLTLWKFSSGKPEILQKFNTLYTSNKSTAMKDRLLFSIVNALSCSKEILAAMQNKILTLDFTDEQNAKDISSILTTLTFLDSTNKPDEQIKTNVLDILLTEQISLTDINEKLKLIATNKIKEMLPDERMHIETISKLWEEWGTLEPIFVYAEKMRVAGNNKIISYLAEMVVHMDPPAYEKWKAWRYETQNNPTKNEQIGHLNSYEQTIWRENHFVEVQDTIEDAIPDDKPTKIKNFIEGSIREGHIFSGVITVDPKYAFIQQQLYLICRESDANPENRDTIIHTAIASIQTDIQNLQAIERQSILPKLENAYKLFTEKKQISINSKTKNALQFLENYISKEQFLKMKDLYAEAEKNGEKFIDAQTFIGNDFEKNIAQTIQSITAESTQALQSDICKKYDIDPQAKNPTVLRNKLNELKILKDLLLLQKLDSETIAQDRLSLTTASSDALSTTFENLKKYFKDNLTFVQDLENMQAVLPDREQIFRKRKLVMMITDSPQMLLQAGKYPTGCGSCQNYEGDSSWNCALGGYVGDAHTKVSFLIDLNKLPEDIQEEIAQKGFEAVKSKIPEQMLLEASIARSIIKMVKTSEGKPAIFIEPTYTSLNKSDKSMNSVFNSAVSRYIAKAMGIQIYRGSNDKSQIRVTVPPSNNPGGQYEDCGAGNAGNAGMGIMREAYTMPAVEII